MKFRYNTTSDYPSLAKVNIGGKLIYKNMKDRLLVDNSRYLNKSYVKPIGYEVPKKNIVDIEIVNSNNPPVENNKIIKPKDEPTNIVGSSVKLKTIDRNKLLNEIYRSMNRK